MAESQMVSKFVHLVLFYVGVAVFMCFSFLLFLNLEFTDRDFEAILSPGHTRDLDYITRDLRYKPSGQDNLTSYHYVIVVPTSTNIVAFKHVLRSLLQVERIQEAFLLFVHDEIDVNILVEIDLLPLTNKAEVIYEYSIYMRPEMFPGFSPSDCSWDLTKEEAYAAKCHNHEWTDVRGEYRRPWLAHDRHLWWWTMNIVFQDLNMPDDPHVQVLFLEKHQLVSRGILNVLDRLVLLTDKHCKECLISLGNLRIYGSKDVANMRAINIRPYTTKNRHYGLVFNKKLWKRIKRYTKQFCEFDDYDWRHGLQYILNYWVKTGSSEISIGFPLVYPLKTCEVKDLQCSVDHIKTYYENLGSELKLDIVNNMFLGVVEKTTNKSKMRAGGGWGDSRDQGLCKLMAD